MRTNTLMRRWKTLGMCLMPVAVLATITYVGHVNYCSGVSAETSVIDIGYSSDELLANGWFGLSDDGREWLYPGDCVDEVATPR